MISLIHSLNRVRLLKLLGLKQLHKYLPPLCSSTAIFCGAGISLRSQIPLVNQIKRQVFKSLKCPTKDYYIYKKIKFPFEGFVEILNEYEDLVDFYELFNSDKINNYHEFIAELAKNNIVDTFITTNFDTLIEQAFLKKSLKPNVNFSVITKEADLEKAQKIKIFKLHGSIGDKTALGITLKKIATQTNIYATGNLITAALLNKKNIVFWGYSFSDIFDIDPFFKNSETKKISACIISHAESNYNIEKWSNYKYFSKCVRILFKTEAIISLYRQKLFSNKVKWPTINANTRNTWKIKYKKWLLTTKHYASPNQSSLILAGFFLRTSLNKVAKKQLDKVNISARNYSIGTYYELKGQYFRNISNYLKSIDYLYKASNFQNSENNIPKFYELQIDIASNYIQLGNYEKSKRILENLLRMDKTNRSAFKMEILNYLGYIESLNGDYTSSLKILKKAKRIGDNNSNLILQSVVFGHIGNTYIRLNKPNLAIRYYNKNLEISEKFGDPGSINHSLGNLGTAYRKLKRFDISLDYQQKALKIALPTKENYLIRNHYANIGICYRNLGQLDLAIYNLRKAIILSKKVKDGVGIAINMANLGRCYTRTNRRLALYYLNKSLKFIIQKFGIRHSFYLNVVDSIKEVLDFWNNSPQR